VTKQFYIINGLDGLDCFALLAMTIFPIFNALLRNLGLMIMSPATPAVLPPDRQNVQMTGRMFFPHQPEKNMPATASEEDDTQCNYSRSLSCCTARKSSCMFPD